MCRECQDRILHHRLQRKPPVSDPGMLHGTCVTHVPWCMSGSLTLGGGENVPGIPSAGSTPQFYVSGKRPIDYMVLLFIQWITRNPYQITYHFPTFQLRLWRFEGEAQNSGHTSNTVFRGSGWNNYHERGEYTSFYILSQHPDFENET